MIKLAIALISVVFLQAQDHELARLEWKFEKGQTLRYNITVSIEDVELSSRSDFAFRWRWDVQEVSQEGTATIKWTFERVKASRFDSDTHAKAEEHDLIGRCYSGMAGKSIIIKLTKRGICQSTKGTKELAEAARNALSEDLRDLQVVNEEEFIGGGTWRDHVAFCLGVLPPGPVKGKATWDDKRSNSMVMGTIEGKVKSTLEKLGENNRAFITEKGELAPDTVLKSSTSAYESQWDVDRGRLLSKKGELECVIDFLGKPKTLRANLIVSLIQ